MTFLQGSIPQLVRVRGGDCGYYCALSGAPTCHHELIQCGDDADGALASKPLHAFAIGWSEGGHSGDAAIMHQLHG
jgi:hypothetical protein